MKRLVMLFALAISTPALAQQDSAAKDVGVIATRAMWRATTNYLQQSAEQMPEADYAFRPVATVRTFGQQLGHVAGTQNLICATVLGEPVKSEDDIEKRMTTKADLVAALKASTDYCARAYALSDVALAAKVKLFGQEQSKMASLSLNAVHNGEHYGNLVTYFRIKGMVPPSSRGN